ncbi:hypothetical protein MAP00_000699 [Monascus purpureus]|nr:hypothetical protein MAP00_000699 [Monascus purpureus]
MITCLRFVLSKSAPDYRLSQHTILFSEGRYLSHRLKLEAICTPGESGGKEPTPARSLVNRAPFANSGSPEPLKKRLMKVVSGRGCILWTASFQREQLEMDACPSLVSFTASIRIAIRSKLRTA